jgi:hypothetical protein
LDLDVARYEEVPNEDEDGKEKEEGTETDDDGKEGVDLILAVDDLERHKDDYCDCEEGEEDQEGEE